MMMRSKTYQQSRAHSLSTYFRQSAKERESRENHTEIFQNFSTRMVSGRDSWPCFLARSVTLSFGPGSKQTYCQLVLFVGAVGAVGAVCSHGQGFLLKLLTHFFQLSCM